MADRQWFSQGVQVYETGEEEYFVAGVQVCEDQAAAPAGTIVPQMMQQGLYVGSML